MIADCPEPTLSSFYLDPGLVNFLFSPYPFSLVEEARITTIHERRKASDLTLHHAAIVHVAHAVSCLAAANNGREEEDLGQHNVPEKMFMASKLYGIIALD